MANGWAIVMVTTVSKRVLLAWEMGGGLGHIRRLIGVGRALRERGWQPYFALRDTDSLADEVGEVAVQVFRAPAHTRQLGRGEKFNAVSYADFVAVCGYRSPAALAGSVDAWDRLIGEIKPDLILADYAPLLHLAAFGRLPLIVVGSGFTVPPCEAEEFPRLRSGGTPLAPAALLVENARSALQHRTCELPKTLTQIMAGQAQFVAVPPMLDVYRSHRTQPADGALDDLPGPLPALTDPAARSVFFYLAADFPGTVPLLRDVAAMGLAAEGFLRSADRRLCAALRTAGINVHEHPVPLNKALSRNAIIVHHGGIGTSMQALALGRPQLILHRHMEQHFNAHMLSRLGIAKSLNQTGAADEKRPSEEALFDLPDNAAHRARRVSERMVRLGSMNKLIALCDALVD